MSLQTLVLDFELVSKGSKGLQGYFHLSKEEPRLLQLIVVEAVSVVADVAVAVVVAVAAERLIICWTPNLFDIQQRYFLNVGQIGLQRCYYYS